ncbi:MAG: glycosyltransferase, partial [Planctomycetota bacterium]
AAACGVPLVTTRVGNMPEFLEDGSNGYFIERRPEDLARRLTELRDDAGLRRRMGAAARRTAERWDWTVQAEGYRAMFEELLGAKDRTRQHESMEGRLA